MKGSKKNSQEIKKTKEPVEPIRDVFDIENMKDILKRQSWRNYFLFVFGINSGLRISDILKLKVKDLKYKDYFTVRQKKRNKFNKIPINETLKADIEWYIKGKKENEYLFTSRKGGKPILRMQAYRILNGAANTLGIPRIGTHSLRKTFGYHFYKFSKKNIAVLMDMFGHSHPKETLRYIGIEYDDKKEAMEGFGL